MDIKSTVALVTGGASGLGEATVRHLVGQGAKAVIVDRNSERGTALAEELGESARFVEADVTSPEQVGEAIEVAGSMGTLRMVISCAGIGWAQRTVGRDGAPHDLDAFKKTISVNLIGTFNVLRLGAAAMSALEPLEHGERGVIINTASVAAYEGQIGQVAYAASKGGIVGMTLPAARDLAKSGVRVVTIAPGLFQTPLLGMLPQQVQDGLARSIPYPSRLGDPREYARLVESIATNPYLNGETIRLDGALRMAPR